MIKQGDGGNISARINFPVQRISDSEKNKDDQAWFRQCLDQALSMSYYYDNNFSFNNIRSFRRNKIVNYNLIQGFVDTEEMARVLNPLNTKDAENYAQYKNYPIIQPRLQVLIGEERERFFNPIVTVRNADVVTEHEEVIAQQFDQVLAQTMVQGITDQRVIEEKLKQVNEFRLNYRDRKSRLATNIVQYLYKDLELKEEFSRGFWDFLVAGEEIYWVDILGGDVICHRANPLRTFNVRSGESYKIDDSDVVLVDEFWPVGRVIDMYHDVLSEDEIDLLERGRAAQGNSGGYFQPQALNAYFSPDQYYNLNSNQGQVDQSQIFAANSTGVFAFGGSFDGDGNVRVSRVRWRGMRKVGFLEWYDDFGIHKEIVPEGYKPDKQKGETVKWEWIDEIYEGTRIGQNIYLKLQPMAFQQRKLDNPSICSIGVVGTSLNVNNNRAYSLVDLTRDYQTMFNAFMYKLHQSISTYIGDVALIPLHLIPDKLGDYKNVLHYIESTKTLAIDAFNESNKGHLMGKLAGGMSGIPNSLKIGDLQSIKVFTDLLTYIDNMISQITGITPQRLGASSPSETMGGMQQSIVQSTFVTSNLYGVHDSTKCRVLKNLVEAAKVAWPSSMKKNYLLDDGSIAMLDFDKSLIVDSEVGVHISSSKDDQDMYNSLKGLIQPFMQNGGSMSMVIDIFNTKDPATLQKKFKTFEDNIQQMEQQAKQDEMAQQQQQMQQQYQLKIEELDRHDMNAELDRQMQIEKATIASLGFDKNKDENNNGIVDVLEQSKLAQEHMKANYDIAIKQKELDLKDKHHKDTIDIEKKKIFSAERMQKIKEKAENDRAKLAARVSMASKKK